MWWVVMIMTVVEHQENRRRRRGRLFALMVALALVWIGTVAFFIHREPPPGSSSIAALQSDVRKAVMKRDAHALERLFAADSISGGYVAAYLEKLKGSDPQSLEVGTADFSNRVLLTVSGRSSKGGALCTQWEVTRNGKRWVLDGVPPVTTMGCS
jgi:hypothetical protein